MKRRLHIVPTRLAAAIVVAATGFGPGRSVPVPLENASPGHGLAFSAVPVHRHPAWKGHITGLRLLWENAGPASDVTIRAIHTAVDSRHPTTNSLFVLGFQPTTDGYEVHPRLPKEWPSLTINGIRFQNQILDITAHAGGRVEVKPRNP